MAWVKICKPAAVEFGDGLLVFRGVPEQFADLGRIVAVGLEHGGGVGFHHAVEHGLDHAA